METDELQNSDIVNKQIQTVAISKAERSSAWAILGDIKSLMYTTVTRWRDMSYETFCFWLI